MTNVAPLIAFLHTPSINSMIDELCANPGSNLDTAKETLIWAVCFSAVMSMTPQQCLSTLNEDHDMCIRDYRIAVGEALAKAKFISSQDICTLQAAVLFLLCLRRCGDSRIVWIETSIVVRIAQCQGVHRDGERLGLSPFVTEMRRRLWWHICILDMLCSEDQGTDTHIRPEIFDAKIPSNIDISELNPQLTALPPAQQGYTDITLCIIQCEMMSDLYWVVKSLNKDTRQPSMLERGKLLSELADRLERQHLRHFDLNIPIQWLMAVIARLTLSKAWLVHSLNASTSDTTLSTKNDEIFHMGVEILQFATLLQNNEMTKQWSWICKSYKQQHVAAFILSELSARPITTETEHAWEVVTRLYSQWVQEDPQTNAMLQNPLSRLMERAVLSWEKKLAEDDAGSSGRYSNILNPAVEKIKESNTIPTPTDLLPYGFVHSDIEMDLGNANVVPSEVSMLEVDTTFSSELYEFPLPSLDWLTGPLF
jgi:Fungal specific transcription factor domain